MSDIHLVFTCLDCGKRTLSSLIERLSAGMSG